MSDFASFLNVKEIRSCETCQISDQFFVKHLIYTLLYINQLLNPVEKFYIPNPNMAHLRFSGRSTPHMGFEDVDNLICGNYDKLDDEKYDAMIPAFF